MARTSGGFDLDLGLTFKLKLLLSPCTKLFCDDGSVISPNRCGGVAQSNVTLQSFYTKTVKLYKSAQINFSFLVLILFLFA